MIHLGDICKLSGDSVPLVDIVCGGSPCQDLSVAGKREGLAGARSGLFMEQIRIIKEMRDVSRKRVIAGTDKYIRPRYMVWENVPGAFSSNKGEDFRSYSQEQAQSLYGRVKSRNSRLRSQRNILDELPRHNTQGAATYTTRELFIATTRRGGYDGTRRDMIKDLTGKRFGKLTALNYISGGNSLKWICRCDCGKEVIAYGYDLQRGRVISCGCRKIKHGGRYTKLYGVWLGMRKRCNNPNHKFYKYYGGKGISVCDEWNDFSVFRVWALTNGYKENLTIDRIDSNKNYCPDNCQWITGSENTIKANHERYRKQKQTV